MKCCCSFGAAVGGEWPEFQCYDCPVHTEPLMAEPHNKCRRHRRASASSLMKEAT